MSDLKPPLSGYSLWLEAIDSDQAFLQSIVDDLAILYDTTIFSAHATLIGLLDKKSSDLADIKLACEKIAGGYQGVASEIIGVGVRDAHFQSVFLLSAPSQDLTDLNDKARKLLGHESDPPFMPHWSALYGDIDRQTKVTIAHDLIAKVTFPRVVTINNIALADVYGHPDEWKVVARYPLNG